MGKAVGRATSLYLRRYYWVDRLPVGRTGVLLYQYGGAGNGHLGGTHNGSLALGAQWESNRFVLVNGDSTGALSRSVVPVKQWFRVETTLDFAAAQPTQTAQLFLGSALESATPTETFSAPLTRWYADYVEDGIVTSPKALINVRIDEAANGTSWLGPAV